MKLNENPLRVDSNIPMTFRQNKNQWPEKRAREREREEKLYSDDREIKAKIKIEKRQEINKKRKERKNQNTFKPKSNGLICEGFNKNSSVIINTSNDLFIPFRFGLFCFVFLLSFLWFSSTTTAMTDGRTSNYIIKKWIYFWMSSSLIFDPIFDLRVDNRPVSSIFPFF